MATQLDDRTNVPTSRTEPGEAEQRFVSLAAQIGPTAAPAFVAELNESLHALAIRHGAQVMQPAFVMERELAGLATLVRDVSDADGRVAALALQAGDTVRAYVQHNEVRFARITAIDPEPEFNDGPYFWLEGFSERLHWRHIQVPRNETQRAYWSLRPGDEVEVWCETLPDKLGRYSRDRRHPKGFRCTGRGEWHRVNVLAVESREFLDNHDYDRSGWREAARRNEDHVPDILTDAWEWHRVNVHSREVSLSDEGVVRFGAIRRRS